MYLPYSPEVASPRLKGWFCHPQQMTGILSLKRLLKLPPLGLYPSQMNEGKVKGRAYPFLLWLWCGSNSLPHIALARAWSHGHENKDGKCSLYWDAQQKFRCSFISLVHHIIFRMLTLKGLRFYAICKIVSFPGTVSWILAKDMGLLGQEQWFMTHGTASSMSITISASVYLALPSPTGAMRWAWMGACTHSWSHYRRRILNLVNLL